MCRFSGRVLIGKERSKVLRVFSICCKVELPLKYVDFVLPVIGSSSYHVAHGTNDSACRSKRCRSKFFVVRDRRLLDAAWFRRLKHLSQCPTLRSSAHALSRAYDGYFDNRMPHFIDVVVKIVPDGLADATPAGRVVVGGSTSNFRLDQFVNGKDHHVATLAFLLVPASVRVSICLHACVESVSNVVSVRVRVGSVRAFEPTQVGRFCMPGTNVSIGCRGLYCSSL